jgi:phosphatidate cytidylyltransferase
MANVSRKVLIRVAGAPVLLAALGAILYGDYRWKTNAGLRFLLTAVAILGCLEFYALCGARGIRTARVIGTACTAAIMFPWSWMAQKTGMGGIRADFLMMVYLIPTALTVYVLIKLVLRHGRFTVEGAVFTIAGFVYVGMLSFIIRPPVTGPGSVFYLLFLVATNKGSDMAAYATGKLIGRRKMTPVLSPNKTWEGAAGGAAAGTALGSAVLLATPLRGELAQAPVLLLGGLAFLVTVAAQLGDLVESAFKRWAGVKDSGGLIPEFGGMLDMADSFILSIPVAHVLTMILA